MNTYNNGQSSFAPSSGAAGPRNQPESLPKAALAHEAMLFAARNGFWVSDRAGSLPMVCDDCGARLSKCTAEQSMNRHWLRSKHRISCRYHPAMDRDIYPNSGEQDAQASFVNAEYLASPTFRVSVGERTMKKNFYIHRGIAASRATLFKDALKGSAADADGLTVSLPEEDPEVFLLYMQTLYSGQVQVTNANHKFLALSKALVLAAKLKDNKAEAMMLNAILGHSKSAAFTGGTAELPDLDAVAIIYRGTAPTDPARALLVKLYTNMAKELPPTYGGGHRDIHPEFMSDLLQSVLANRPFPEINGTTGPLKDGHVGPCTRSYLPIISEPILPGPPVQTPGKVEQSASILRSANSGPLPRVPGDSKPPVSMSRSANPGPVVLNTKSEVPSDKKPAVGTSRSSSPNIRPMWLDSNFRIAKDKKLPLSIQRSAEIKPTWLDSNFRVISDNGPPVSTSPPASTRGSIFPPLPSRYLNIIADLSDGEDWSMSG